MRRRAFIAALGSAAAWPVVASAQYSDKIPRIGVLWHAGNEKEEAIYLGALRKGLNDLGYVEGKNIELVNRFADEHYDTFDTLATELVDTRVDVIVASIPRAGMAAKRASTATPIVAAYGAEFLVEELAHPGGNITGLSSKLFDLAGKHLEVLNLALSNYKSQAETAAASLQVPLNVINVRSPDDLEQAFSEIAQTRADAALITPDGLFFQQRRRNASFTANQIHFGNQPQDGKKLGIVHSRNSARPRRRGHRVNRRAFITAVGGAAAWPLTLRAQNAPPGKIWRVGYLSGSSTTDFSLALSNAFRLKLQELGYVEGKNLRLDVRRAEFDYTRLPALAAELISLTPDVLVGISPPATTALKQATSSIPIVMVAIPDPIGGGFVKSFAHPGGNITGNSDMSVELAPKSLDLLHVVVPNAKRIAVLTMSYSLQRAKVDAVRTAAEALGLTTFLVPTPTDLDSAFKAIQNENCDALVVIADGRLNRKIVELANASRLPAIYQIIDYVDIGGLLGYGPDGSWMFPNAAIYVDKILRGVRPADLPVEQPTELELRVNLKTAKALRLTIPDSVLIRADKVIE
jgi:putative ABC transport system substrate-binding protein